MTTLAYNMAGAGRRVKFFALEAGDAEIETRIRFQRMTENRFAAGLKNAVDYVAWSRGLLPDLKRFEPDDQAIKKVLQNIDITYKKSSRYGIEQLERDIVAVKKDVDVVLVDHLHYIDRGTKKNETEALSEIVHRIRDINLASDKTMILAAHVKKNQEAKRFQTLLPSLDDIYGSGDISKTATWVMSLAQPNAADEDKFPVFGFGRLEHGAPTLVRFLKSRDGGGSRTAFTLVPFFRRGTYADQYTIGKTEKGDTVWSRIATLPAWARSAFVYTPDAPESGKFGKAA